MRRLLLLPALLVASCTAGSAVGTLPPAAPPPTPSPATPATPATTTPASLPARSTPPPEAPWEAARALDELAVFAWPGADQPKLTLPASTLLGTPTVVLIRRRTGHGWLRVELPGRPNGAEGWVRADDVVVFPILREVVVDLSERVLRVREAGEVLVETAVAVGGGSSPTPAGLFYVTDAVRLLDTSGPWGPFALGLSARSDTVTEFNGGDGIIGIHGTNRPSSIGQAASLGCVRVPNEIMLEIADLVAVGTPVLIEE